MRPVSRHASIAFAVASLAGVAGCQAGSVADAEAPEGEMAEVEVAESSPVPEETQTVQPDATLGDYADGTFEATGNYQSPNGAETVGVSLDLVDGIIQAVTVTPNPSNATTERYQGIFRDNIAAEIIGVPLAEVKVDRVAGSSLTGGGFNDALDQIREAALKG